MQAAACTQGPLVPCSSVDHAPRCSCLPCSIMAVTSSSTAFSAPPIAAGVLLAAYGVGAEVLEDFPVVSEGGNHRWSALQQQFDPGPLYVGSAAAWKVRAYLISYCLRGQSSSV